MIAVVRVSVVLLPTDSTIARLYSSKVQHVCNNRDHFCFGFSRTCKSNGEDQYKTKTLINRNLQPSPQQVLDILSQSYLCIFLYTSYHSSHSHTHTPDTAGRGGMMKMMMMIRMVTWLMMMFLMSLLLLLHQQVL